MPDTAAPQLSVKNGDTFCEKAAVRMKYFAAVTVDGETLSAEKYTVSENSAIEKLTADYLSILAAGTHTPVGHSASGAPTTTFTIAEKPLSPKTDSTADNASVDLSRGILSGCLSLTELLRKKSRCI